MSTFPIVVCGTGIAGLAMALGLARDGHKPVLLGPEHVPASAHPDVYHPRVYAISAQSQRFLARLGVWDMLDSRRITPVESMQVYGDAGGHVDLQAWQAVQPEMAWIVESGELERGLTQVLRVFGVPRHQERFERLEDGFVHTDAGSRLPAALLVGADGAQSAVRKAAGIHSRSRAYRHTGVVTHLTVERAHGNAAMQWFGPDGILALLPLPDTSDGHQVSMVWSMDDAQARSLLAMAPDERDARLKVQLMAASGGVLGRMQVRSGVHGFPLFLEHSAMVAPGVALVGDAAHRIHPLAGQGLNLGLGDVGQLLAVLRERPAACSPGQFNVLQRYRRARAQPVMAMSAVTDGLQRLFETSAAPVVLARNIGMQVVDRLPFVKRRLILGAAGAAPEE